MSHGLLKKWVYMDTTNWVAPEREYMDFDEDAIRKYIKTHPIPQNKTLKTVDEIVAELCQSTGIIALSPDDYSDEFIEWFDDLIEESAGCLHLSKDTDKEEINDEDNETEE